MKLSEIIRKEWVHFINAESKDDAIAELVMILLNDNAISDAEKVMEMIRAREALMSTGIGLEIGVPHVRLEGSTAPIIAIGISKKGICDYVSMDNKPVRIMCMIIVNKGAHKEYIQLLSQIAKMLKNQALRDEVIAAENSEAVYSILMRECS